MNIRDNLAYDFFTAGGLNSLAVKANCSLHEPAQITSLITNGLDAGSAAQEAIEGWGLDRAEQGELTHMMRNGYTREDLVEAMQCFIDQHPDIINSQRAKPPAPKYIPGVLYGWKGGPRPVQSDCLVQAVLRSGNVTEELPAGSLHWDSYGYVSDIIAFVIVKPD